MKSKKNKKTSKNKTVKNTFDTKLFESYRKETLVPFEKEYEKTLGKNLLKAHEESSKSFNEKLRKIEDQKREVNEILPKDDFYDFVNDVWIKNIVITDKTQHYITQIDDFRLVQDVVYENIIHIIENYIKDNNNKLSHCLKNFYYSGVNLKNFSKNKVYAEKHVELVDNYMKDKSNVWKLLGYMNRNEIYSWACPFYWKVSQDEKNVDKLQSHISSPRFSLTYFSVYYDDGTKVDYKKKYINKFVKYVNNTFSLYLGNNHGFNPRDVFDVEVQIFQALGCLEIKEPKDKYSRITGKEALDKYGFNWHELSKAIGFTKTPDFFITNNLNYLKCGTKLLLENWDSEKWRTYWVFIYFRQLSRFGEFGKAIYNDFYSKYLLGQKRPITDKLKATLLTCFAFNTFITNEYIKKYENLANIEYLKILSEELKTVFIRIIKRNTWLDTKTKNYALMKLNHIKIIIGSPSKLTPDPLLDYDSKDLFGNILKITEWRLHQFIKLNNKKPIEDATVIDWFSTPIKFVGNQAYVVNASYTPSTNSIYIPLAYIQKPFFDLGRTSSFEYNLAHIGFTISHELSHALDDWGSKYDYKGNLYDWWTEGDKKEYKKIQDEVVKQYEDWAKKDNIIFEAEPTLGEDLADISAIATITEYLIDAQNSNKEFIPIMATSLQKMFMFYAYQMRQKIYKKALRYQLETNPHPPNKYRTNIPLSRSPEFKNIYNVKKGDEMYWHNNNRVWQN